MDTDTTRTRGMGAVKESVSFSAYIMQKKSEDSSGLDHVSAIASKLMR